MTADPDSFASTALDGEPRTDTWLSNAEEMALSEQPGQSGLDLFDPDSDDGSVTDEGTALESDPSV